MNPLLDLVQEERAERSFGASSERSVAQKNTDSLNLLDQMMRGVSRKR